MAVRIDMLTIKGIVGQMQPRDGQHLDLSQQTEEKIINNCVKQVLKIINKTNERQYGSFDR